MSYTCELCHFSTPFKSNYNKHLKTKKHAYKLQNDSPSFNCMYCYKSYKSRNGLWQHNKKCLPPLPLQQQQQIVTNEDIIRILLKLQKTEEIALKTEGLMQTLIASNVNVNLNQTNNIENNIDIENNVENMHNSFNLQIFLNETCKEALNITEFADSIICDINDVKKVGKMGYVDGITDIIVSHLRRLAENKRPLHCCDLKRQVIYIKDNDKWEKDENQEKTRKFVHQVTKKNSRAIAFYQEKYPDYAKHDFKHEIEYNEIVVEALGGKTLDFKTNQAKIIKKIAREITIEKKMVS